MSPKLSPRWVSGRFTQTVSQGLRHALVLMVLATYQPVQGEESSGVSGKAVDEKHKGIVEGVIRSSDGSPLSMRFGEMTLQPESEKGRATVNHHLSMNTKEGVISFKYTQLEEGLSLRLVIDMPGYATWVSPYFAAKPLMAPLEAILKPVPPITLTGELINAKTGKPLTDCRVTVCKYTPEGYRLDDSAIMAEEGVSSDEKGHYEISTLKEGDRFKLQVWMKNASDQQWVDVSRAKGPNDDFSDLYFPASSKGAFAITGTSPIHLPPASFNPPEWPQSQ